jgi:hypothetical protein
VEIRRIVVPGQPRQKVGETPSHVISWCTPHIPALCGKHKWEDSGPGKPGQKGETLSRKIAKAEKGWREREIERD